VGALPKGWRPTLTKSRQIPFLTIFYPHLPWFANEYSWILLLTMFHWEGEFITHNSLLHNSEIFFRRVVFELFNDIVPITTEKWEKHTGILQSNSAYLSRSFRALCTGEKGLSPLSQLPLHYKNSIMHRCIKGFMVQGGGKSSIVFKNLHKYTYPITAKTLPSSVGKAAKAYMALLSKMKISREPLIRKGEFTHIHI